MEKPLLSHKGLKIAIIEVVRGTHIKRGQVVVPTYGWTICHLGCSEGGIDAVGLIVDTGPERRAPCHAYGVGPTQGGHVAGR